MKTPRLHLSASGLNYCVVISVVMLIIGLMAGCVSHPPAVGGAPTWVNELPKGESVAVGSASYEIFGEAKARENATMKALSALALQKGGIVDLEGEVHNVQSVSSVNGGERVRDRSVVSTKVVIKGQDIPVRGRVQSYWKDTTARRVWVLMVEEK